MDDFLHYCYSIIIKDISYRMNLSGLFKPSMLITRCSESLHAFIKTIYNSYIKFNYNKEGLLHSNYLGNRYEPAIIIQYYDSEQYYYLFDGEIKDCNHPFAITRYLDEPLQHVLYYSSERLEKTLPIKICEHREKVLKYHYTDPDLSIAANLCSRGLLIPIKDYTRYDYTLHDYITPQLFKFAN